MRDLSQETERIEALLARAQALKEELTRVEQDLYDLGFDGYQYVTGAIRRKSAREESGS